MRKYFIVLGLLLLGLNVQSQVLISLLFGDKLNSDGLEFGLEGGLNFSKISGLEANKSLRALNLGLSISNLNSITKKPGTDLI